MATAVAYAESGLRPDAVGDTTTAYASYGVFQIRALPGRPAPDKLKDYRYNIKYAYDMWCSQNWYPWSAWLNGSFKNYL